MDDTCSSCSESEGDISEEDQSEVRSQESSSSFDQSENQQIQAASNSFKPAQAPLSLSVVTSFGGSYDTRTN